MGQNELRKKSVETLLCSNLIEFMRRTKFNSLLYNVPMHKTDRLQRLQNQCARILTKSLRREHITRF